MGQRVELEERLREQSALAKLGEMAVVIAHEVKNPLAGIRGVVQVIGGRLSADSTDAQMMKEIVSRIDSLDGLMKDLLLFARYSRRRPEQDVCTLLHHQVERHGVGLADGAGLRRGASWTDSCRLSASRWHDGHRAVAGLSVARAVQKSIACCLPNPIALSALDGCARRSWAPTTASSRHQV